MGCFLGCFGFSGKRIRRKPANKVSPRDHRHGSYEPLDSLVCVNLDIAENLIGNKIKESSGNKIIKKVSFNLNVQTYEPLTNDETTYQLSESDEDGKREKNGEKAEGSQSPVSEGDITASKTGSFPTNYRYQNCRDNYDEEDDMAYIESDLDDEDEDEDEDEDDFENDVDDLRISQNEFLKQADYQAVELTDTVSLIHLDERKNNNHMQLPASTDGESKSFESKRTARDRCKCVNSVLNPVENLTQWKAIKSRTAAAKNSRKENIALQLEPIIPFDLKTGSNLYLGNLAPLHNQSKPLLQEIAVDASLSNWLASTNCNKSKADTSITNTSIPFETIPSKKSMFDRSYSQQSREDRPILDITNLKA